MATSKTISSKAVPTDAMPSPQFYHGTKANLKPDDLIEPGFNSNYGSRKKAAYSPGIGRQMRLLGNREV